MFDLLGHSLALVLPGWSQSLVSTFEAPVIQCQWQLPLPYHSTEYSVYRSAWAYFCGGLPGNLVERPNSKCCSYGVPGLVLLFPKDRAWKYLPQSTKIEWPEKPGKAWGFTGCAAFVSLFLLAATLCSTIKMETIMSLRIVGMVDSTL